MFGFTATPHLNYLRAEAISQTYSNDTHKSKIEAIDSLYGVLLKSFTDKKAYQKLDRMPLSVTTQRGDLMEIQREIPQISDQKSIGEFLKKTLQLFKTNFSTERFKSTLDSVGLSSRVTYRQVVSGKRRFSESKLPFLARTFDFSFSEIMAAKALLRKEPVETPSPIKYEMGSADTLSDPINTIILNMCALAKSPSLLDLQSALCFFWNSDQIEQILLRLVEAQKIEKLGDNTFRRVAVAHKISTPHGVKIDFAEKFMKASLDLAKRAYDLDHEAREFAAFTAKIKASDFSKVKDLIRDFRVAVYNLSDESANDCVIQVNVNSFITNPTQVNDHP